MTLDPIINHGISITTGNCTLTFRVVDSTNIFPNLPPKLHIDLADYGSDGFHPRAVAGLEMSLDAGRRFLADMYQPATASGYTIALDAAAGQKAYFVIRRYRSDAPLFAQRKAVRRVPTSYTELQGIQDYLRSALALAGQTMPAKSVPTLAPIPGAPPGAPVPPFPKS